MNKKIINLFHAPNINVEIKTQISIYAPPDTIYFAPENNDITWFKTIYLAEKEKNEFIRKYDNALKGLNYWKDKALSRE